MSSPISDPLSLNYPPFDILTPEERERLARHGKIVYLDTLTPLPTSWYGDFFVIIKGQVHQLQGEDFIASLYAGDWFDSKPKNATTFSFITQEQSLLYRVNGQALAEVTAHNPTFQNLLFADLSARLTQHQSRLAQSESQQLLYQPISALVNIHIKAPQFIDETATLYEATVAMTSHDAKHILVQSQVRMSDEQRDRLLVQGVEKSSIPDFVERIGMFTQTDVCRAIGDRADFASTPVKQYTNFKLRGIMAQQDVSDALLTMLHNRVHRLPIIDAQGKISGVLGQTELLSYLTNHSNLIAVRIEQAKSLDDVAIAVDLIGKFIRQQQHNGIKTHIISRMVQSLNIQVFSKVWQLIVPTLTYHNTCLLVLGSEGRGEQIMRTDQDNALIIRNGFKDDKLPEYANTFNQTLASMGYPLCDGGIMINNDRWRKTLTAFNQQITQWFSSGTAEDMIWIATLLDAQVVCGVESLFTSLKNHWQFAYNNQSTSNFINRFAKPVLQFGDTGNWWQKFTGAGTDSDIDLKKAGIFPIVHGVKALTLEYSGQYELEATNTKTRLQLLAQHQIIDEKTAQNLTEALDFFMAKRLEVALTTADKSARKVNPSTLSALEKDLLKECLAIVKDFKAFISHHYRLDIF